MKPQATGKIFTMDDKFSLGDLLKLKLHVYADACAEIVDRAQKEAVIEKAIAKIADTWGGLQLNFTPYKVQHLSRPSFPCYTSPPPQWPAVC
jgi:dynein heavy chain